MFGNNQTPQKTDQHRNQGFKIETTSQPSTWGGTHPKEQHLTHSQRTDGGISTNTHESKHNEFEMKRNGNSQRTMEKPYIEKPYPIHNDIQIHSNILQKLFSSGSDLAANQKLTDVSDSDLRMLPFKMIKIAGKYVLGLKLAILLFMAMALMHLLNSEISMAFAYIIGSAYMSICIYWAASILYKSKQYVMGAKTHKYYKGLTTGWTIVETTFTAFALLGGWGIYYITNYGSNLLLLIQTAKNWKLHIGSIIANKAEIMVNILFHTSIFMLASYLVYVLIVLVALRSSKRLQAENRKSMDIDQNREEVADKILEHGYNQ